MRSSEVAAALDTLPRRECLAFVLRDILGGTFEDVGAVLGVSSVRAHQVHDMALRRLRRTLTRRRHEWRYL